MSLHQLPLPPPRPVANIIPLPDGEKVVAMTHFGDDVVLVTDGGVYRVVRDEDDKPRLERLKL